MAQLVLQDGTTFSGESFGAKVDTDGEVVFNTGMVGYPESMTDPSYRGQILCFTYPLIGNYGVPEERLNTWGFSEHFESETIHVRAVICSQVSEDFSHFTAKKSLPAWMEEHGIPGITGVDTRALTKKLRETGVMLGRISQDKGLRTGDLGAIVDPNLRNLVAEVSCKEVLAYEPVLRASSSILDGTRSSTQHDKRITIVAFDCGMKRNILRSFLKRGVGVVRVPWNYDLSKANFSYDGVFISNGPGDPKMCKETIAQVAWAIEQGIPTFGICLGIQLMALAIGGNTYKLKYGHRGANQPCVEKQLATGNLQLETTIANSQLSTAGAKRCIITSQNHGFAVEEKSLPKGWHVWFRNANDQTVEGIRHESGKFFAVQFHPEATPGPEDANYLFDEFLSVLSKRQAISGKR